MHPINRYSGLMRFIVLILLGLVLLGGGGAGAYFYFGQKAEASAGEAGKHADGHGAGDGKKESFEFVELDPLVLPIIDKQGVQQVISLVIAIEVSNHAGVERVNKLAPRLKDAYIQSLYGMLNRHAIMEGGAIRVASVKKKLNAISVDVLGEDVVELVEVAAGDGVAPLLLEFDVLLLVGHGIKEER